MTINKQDIKLMQSQLLSDDGFAGGLMSAAEIVSGSVNSLFVGSSRLDRTLGRVSLRKVFIHISNNGDDAYLGSHIIISDPESDPGVDIIMTSTASDTDIRSEAQEIIQSVIDKSAAINSHWRIINKIAGTENTFEAKSDDNYIARTFPEFDTELTITVGGNTYAISEKPLIPGNECKLILGTALLTNVSTDTPVYDQFGVSRWAIERDSSISENTVYLKHTQYIPGIDDVVLINDKVTSVIAIDDTDWQRPIYAFSDNIGDYALAQLIKTIPTGGALNAFYGVSRLSSDAIADDPFIIVAETDKFIFPVGSELIDEALIGLKSDLLPPDKKVDIFHPGGVIVIHNTQKQDLPNPVVSGSTYNLSGTDYQLIELYDQFDIPLNPDLYSVDLVLGNVVMNFTDMSGYSQPVVAHKRREDMRVTTVIDRDTRKLFLGRPLSQGFTANNTFVSSALVWGDLNVKLPFIFDQETWTEVWQDTLIGANASATYDTTNYPVRLVNGGCITENWALVFNDPTGLTFDIIGERVGHIGTGQINAASGTFTAPINPVTQLPYFKLAQEAWGAGWSVGNALRFKTIALSQAAWFVRVTQQGDNTIDPTDKFIAQIRGDIS